MVTVPALSAVELLEGYGASSVSPVEIIEATLEAIGRSDLNAFWWLDPDTALEAAKDSQRRYREGSARPIEGVPVGIKDIFDTAGLRTTFGSSIFSDRIPTTDADAVAALRNAGAIVVGKTATHEFAFGVTTVNPHYGTTLHPLVRGHIVGGSSGGSAAAVTAGLVPLALGSDTSVSIREPAAFCGCVGLRPTHGTVSTRGAVPLAPSFDAVGPLARTVDDAALMAEVLWRNSPGTARPPEALGEDRPLRIGVMATGWEVPSITEIGAAVDLAASTLGRLGHRVAGVEIAEFRSGPAVFSAIMLPEALEVHRGLGLWPERDDGYGADVSARLRLAEEVTYDENADAVELRQQLRERMHTFFRDVDILLTPTSAVVAPTLENCDSPEHLGHRRTVRDLVFPYLVPAPLCGYPALALPVGRVDNGLPTSILLSAAPGHDRVLLRLGAQLFQELT